MLIRYAERRCLRHAACARYYCRAARYVILLRFIVDAR